MEPISIALICAASFGAIVTLAAFIRMFMLSKDKEANDEAQRRALGQETAALEKMREQMQSSKRFDSHYKVLGANKDAVMYLDTKIEDILRKKAQLIDRYAQISIKESEAIVDGTVSSERKAACDRLKLEIDEEIKFYDKELQHLQQRRTALWDTSDDLQDYLLQQEKTRNENLDFIYKQHSGLLEKVYLRHIDNSEHIAKQSIDAGTSIFKAAFWAPIQFLLQFFNISTGVVPVQSQMEKDTREEVEKVEDEINDPPYNDEPIDDEVIDNDNSDSHTDEPQTEDDDTDKEYESQLVIA